MTLIRNTSTTQAIKLKQLISLPLLRAAYGLLLAVGAPIGWMIVQWLAGRDPLAPAEIDTLLYAYMTIATSIVFSLIGYAVGKREKLITSLALTDELTALYNKRYFKIHLEQEFKRHQRSASPFSVILIDIDFFKRVNDTFGHSAGDEVLKNIASILMASCRKNEVAARVGGEEMCIIAGDCDLDSAYFLAERIRKAIEQSSNNWNSEPIKITASFGIASATTHSKNAWEVYQNADKALYQAKQTGRNKSCTHQVN